MKRNLSNPHNHVRLMVCLFIVRPDFFLMTNLGVDGDTGAGDMGGDDGGAMDNPVLIGGIAAAAVVVAALLVVLLCRSRANKNQRKP